MTKWIVRFRPQLAARLRLFCLPHAGGSATVYRQWATSVAPFVDVCAVEYPGRGTRFREPLFRELRPLVEALADGITPALDLPFAFFGHSLGSLVAFELARTLRRRQRREPAHLFASGRPAPHVKLRRQPLHDLPTPAFMAELRKMNGTPEEVLSNPELMEIYVPILRADFAIEGTYVHAEEAPLDCPISAYGGRADEGVREKHIAAWGRHTRGAFTHRLFDGGHFFLDGNREAVIGQVCAELSQAIA